jgi:acyl-CoA thioester hydrolase
VSDAVPREVVTTIRVRYHECDMQGVVFNALYMTYADMASTDLWRELFGSYQALIERNLDIAVVSSRIDFRASARFDDELALAISISRVGRTSFDLTTHMTRGADVIADSTITYVWFAPDAPGAAIEPPDDVRAVMSANVHKGV